MSPFLHELGTDLVLTKIKQGDKPCYNKNKTRGQTLFGQKKTGDRPCFDKKTRDKPCLTKKNKGQTFYNARTVPLFKLSIHSSKPGLSPIK